jgi:hypothetical protein
MNPKSNYQKIEVGTVIHGTLRTEDLLPAFTHELARVANPHACSELLVEAMSWIGREEPADGEELEDFIESRHDVLVRLLDALDECAPFGIYFGPHEGDGADFGWWLIDEPEDLDDADSSDPRSEDVPDDTPSLDTSFHDHEMDVDDDEPSPSRQFDMALDDAAYAASTAIEKYYGKLDVHKGFDLACELNSAIEPVLRKWRASLPVGSHGWPKDTAGHVPIYQVVVEYKAAPAFWAPATPNADAAREQYACECSHIAKGGIHKVVLLKDGVAVAVATENMDAH